MLRLVKTDFASAGKPDVGDRPPPCFLHCRTLDAFLPECRYLGLQIVTHEIEFVPVIPFIGMDRRLCRRQLENQPSEDIPEEGAISRRILSCIRLHAHQKS